MSELFSPFALSSIHVQKQCFIISSCSETVLHYFLFRNCKSKEAEVKRINKELANIRSKFKVSPVDHLYNTSMLDRKNDF